MDSRIHGKEIKFNYYNIPPYTRQIELLIRLGRINLIENRDGNGYISFDKIEHRSLYETIEGLLCLPSHSIVEININTERHKLDIYTFSTITSYGLKQLEREYTIGYGLDDCIGLHIDFHPDWLLLLQLQIYANNLEPRHKQGEEQEVKEMMIKQQEEEQDGERNDDKTQTNRQYTRSTFKSTRNSKHHI